MYEIFASLPPDRVFNIIDSILINDAISDGLANGEIKKKRAALNKIYDRIMFEDSSNDEYYGNHTPGTAHPPTMYHEIDEAGIPGLPPVG